MTNIQTTRFGTVALNPGSSIVFRDGMIGFAKLKNFVLIENTQMPLMLWLQSVEAPEIAFPVIEPYFFKRDYKVSYSAADKAALALNGEDKTKVFVVVTIPEDITQMTANMKAPVVVNLAKGTGAQLILQDKDLNVKHLAHEAFSNAVSALQYFESEEPTADRWNTVDYKLRLVEGTLP